MHVIAFCSEVTTRMWVKGLVLRLAMYKAKELIMNVNLM